MAGLGNPLAFALGGGQSPQEAIYNAMRSSVGTGNSADGGVYDTIIESWRWARARGIAAAWADDRAAMQAFPDLATDFIPVYEAVLRRAPEPGESDQSRRDEIVRLWIKAISSVHADLEAILQEIDAGITIEILDPQYTRTSDHGRAFEDHDPTDPTAAGPAFGGGRKQTIVPNFSDDMILLVNLNLGAVPITLSIENVITKVREALREVLPAWVDFRVFTQCGFILDQDLLDVTALCDGVVP